MATSLLTLRMPSLSTEYIKVYTRILENGGVIDPTELLPSMAFTAPNIEPVLTDWKPASWEVVPGNYYYLKCLVGPGGIVVLPEGSYDIWIRIVGASETPVRKVGRLVIT